MFRKIAYLLLILSLPFSGSLVAQPDCHEFNGKYIGSYFKDSWDIIKSPLNWQGKDWLKAGIAGGTFFLLYTQDEQILNFFQRNRTQTTDDLSKYFFDPLGYGFYTMPVLGGLYLYAEIDGRPLMKDFALQGIKVYVVSAALTQMIKQLTHRHRPHQDHPPDPTNWDGPFSDLHYTSFPSGHTVAAFATATFFSEYFKEKKWVPWLAYGLAGGVGLSRINDNEHWATDVFAGAMLGHFMAKFMMKNHSCNVQPTVLRNGKPGISLVFNI